MGRGLRVCRGGPAARAGDPRGPGGDGDRGGRRPAARGGPDRGSARFGESLHCPPVSFPGSRTGGPTGWGAHPFGVDCPGGTRAPVHGPEARPGMAIRRPVPRVCAIRLKRTSLPDRPGWAGRSVRKIAGFANRRSRVQIPTSPFPSWDGSSPDGVRPLRWIADWAWAPPHRGEPGLPSYSIGPRLASHVRSRECPQLVRVQCGRPTGIFRDPLEATTGGVEARPGSIVPDVARHPGTLPRRYEHMDRSNVRTERRIVHPVRRSGRHVPRRPPTVRYGAGGTSRTVLLPAEGRRPESDLPGPEASPVVG